MENLSNTGNNIVGSEIIKISQQIKEISKTKPVTNLTIGDFNSKLWPIPSLLRSEIKNCYDEDLTNYPNSQGEIGLRESVSQHIQHQFDVKYDPDEILIGGGVRPLIYTVYQATVNPGEGVIYPTPSWNNNHYCFLHKAEKQEIPCTPENSFFPTVQDVKERIRRSAANPTSLVCICSPQNPTGRVIDAETLKGICDVIVHENIERAKEDLRPIYLFFDQIYSDLTAEGKFVHPIKLCPEIRDYLICADGISKSLNATGVRVGWLFGPKAIIGKMTEILSHIGAWAPKAEQHAVDRFIRDHHDAYINHVQSVRKDYREFITKICGSLEQLKNKGYNVDYQLPEGGIYISVYLGYVYAFASTEEYISYLINECGLGIVPFEYFGAHHNKGWFRISIGNIAQMNLEIVIETIENAIRKSRSLANSQIF
jgi:aspartate aminotransferase